MSAVTSVKRATKKETERRKLETVCKDCNTDIMHWIHYAMAGEIPEFPPGTNEKYPDWEINRKMFIYDGSLSDIECDVIVVSSTKNLAGKGMALIYKEAGEKLAQAAKKLGPKNVGDVVETKGFNLPTKHVFHAVVPSNSDSKESQYELETCYTNALKLFLDKGYKSIAFPPLGTGIGTGKMNRETAAHIALRVTREWMEVNKNNVTSVIFCRFTDDDREVYDKLVHKYFPVEKKVNTKEIDKVKELSDAIKQKPKKN